MLHVFLSRISSHHSMPHTVIRDETGVLVQDGDDIELIFRTAECNPEGCTRPALTRGDRATANA